MNIQFGSGVLFGNPVAGNLPTNPTPYKFGVLQECTVDFKGDLKKLFGQNQFAVATARGKLEVNIKGKLAVFDVGMYNQLYFAQTQTGGYNLISDNEKHTVSAGAVTATNTPILQDWGVEYTSGQQLINVPSGPTVGQYTVNLTTGAYGFAGGDNGNVVALSYTYASTAGQTITIVNQLMGYAPELKMLLYNRFRTKYLAIQLNDVTLGSISIPTKLEDFWIADFDGSGNADATGTVALLMGDLV